MDRKGELVRRDSEGHPQTPASGAVPLWTPPERKDDGVARRGSGCPEGCKPFGRRYGGCASITYFISFCSPFLEGRGLGGWCARTAGGVPHAPKGGYPQGAPLRWGCAARAPKGESEGHRPYEASAASTAGSEAPTSTTSCGIRIAVSGSFRPEPVITHTTRRPDRG